MPTTDTNVSKVIVNKLTKAQYDTATKSATEFYAVTDVDGESYSTTEQKTGGTWIDGRPIYKKTFSFTTNSSHASTTVQHGISNLDVIVDYGGMLKQSNILYQPIPRAVADNNSGYNIGIGDIDDTVFKLLVGTSVAKGVQAYVTLWYTKTTD